MKIFFDMEFYENGETIELISIGAVRKDFTPYYAVNSDFDEAAFRKDAKARGHEETIEFMDAHVLGDNLCANEHTLKPLETIKAEFLEFCGDSPEFWTSTGAYDWVCLAQMFGKMIELPKGWPHRALDTSQLKHMFPKVDAKFGFDTILSMIYKPTGMTELREHNAFYDAVEVMCKHMNYKAWANNLGMGHIINI